MKRLKDFNEYTIELSLSVEEAMLRFQTAINKHGNVKDISIDDGIIQAKGRYGLQMTNLEFVFEKNESGVTVKCRGKSDDIGNGGAMNKIDKILNTLKQELSGNTELNINKSKRISTKQRLLYVGIAIVALIAFKEIIKGPGEIYGAYYIAGEKEYNNHIELYESRDILLHYDSRFGHGNRWGKYEYDKSKNEIVAVFHDGLPEIEEPLKLEVQGNNWTIKNGSTYYVRSENFHPDNFKVPDERYNYSR